MLDVFAKTVIKANQQFHNLGSQELIEIKQFLSTRNLRFDAVNLISTNANFISSDTISAMVNEYPHLIKAGGNCYPSSRMASCLRDVEIILRYVSYALATGEPSILEERCTNGLKDFYLALEVPLEPLIKTIEILKEKTIDVVMNNPKQNLTITQGDCSSIVAEMSTYFDLVIASLR